MAALGLPLQAVGSAMTSLPAMLAFLAEGILLGPCSTASVSDKAAPAVVLARQAAARAGARVVLATSSWQHSRKPEQVHSEAAVLCEHKVRQDAWDAPCCLSAVCWRGWLRS